MQRLITFSIAALVSVLFLGGCKKKPEYPLCRNSSDCREGEMCVDGRCVQCRSDADCDEGEECVEGTCVEAVGSGDQGQEGVAAGSVKTPHEECSLQKIYFDFDSSVLKAEAVEKLKKTAQCLMLKGAKDIIIEGHCDPRGTEEYNMGLGVRRANAIRNYLVSYGVPEEEITVYSKGEEEASGYNEKTWAYDRKGVFK